MDETKNCSALNKTCFELDKHTYETVRSIKFVVLSLGMLLCSLAIGMIIFFKAYKKFVHRLALYLVIAAFFNCVAFILNSVPVEHNDSRAINGCNYTYVRVEDKAFCYATGCLDQCIRGVILLLVCWITLQLFMLGILKRNYNSLKYEVVGVVTTIVVSLVSSSIPFIDFDDRKVDNETMYGLAGAWCWIKSTNDSCSRLSWGIAEQILLWYGPVLFFDTLNFIAMLAVIIVLYRGKQKAQGSLRLTYKEAIRETLPLLFYPIIFSVIYSLAFVHRVDYVRNKKMNPALLIMHTIAESSLPLFIPLAFLLHPNTLKMLNCYQFRKAWNAWRRQQSEYTETHFVVSREAINEEESERLVITGSRRSETSEYKTLKFLEIKPV